MQCPGPLQVTRSVLHVYYGRPAGLVAAQRLAEAGHMVHILERDLLPGGLLRTGIPSFHLEKWKIDRRVRLMEQHPRIVFRCGVNVGKDISLEELREAYDWVIIATGASEPRHHPMMEGRKLGNVMNAMDYLRAPFVPEGKNLYAIGGGR